METDGPERPLKCSYWTLGIHKLFWVIKPHSLEMSRRNVSLYWLKAPINRWNPHSCLKDSRNFVLQHCSLNPFHCVCVILQYHSVWGSGTHTQPAAEAFCLPGVLCNQRISFNESKVENKGLYYDVTLADCVQAQCVFVCVCVNGYFHCWCDWEWHSPARKMYQSNWHSVWNASSADRQWNCAVCGSLVCVCVCVWSSEQ